MTPRIFWAAAALALAALVPSAYAQHAMTAEQKAAAEAAKAPPAAEETEAPAEESDIDIADIDMSERTIWDGVFTADQAEAGGVLYTANCQVCHGKTGRGGPGGPAITGASMNKNWEYVSLLDFYTFAHTYMPPGKAGTIGSAQDYVNIVAYIMELHGAEPGDTKLVANDEQLANITIVRKPK